MMPLSGQKVELLASTGDTTVARQSPPEGAEDATSSPRPDRRADDGDGGLRGYFETAQWTADGTTILTSSSSNLVSGFVVPADLLSPAARRPLALVPQATIQLPEPSNVLAGAPYFRLAEPWTQQLLVSSYDHPIQLFYLSSADASSSSSSPSPAASYPFVKERSETFLAATSLAWPAPGTHFVAGARNLLAWFDVGRAGAGTEPLLRVKTIPSERHLAKGGGVGMRGTVSALAACPAPDGLVAAGTWTRWVGLYDLPRAGACVATWSVAPAPVEAAGVGGDGVTQTLWSPCGRYLLVGERKSTGVLVYDVRVAGRLLGWLSDREALGNQRINGDVFAGQDGAGFEVWSGTTRGAVKVWEGVGNREGAHPPSWQWAAHRRSTVGSTCVHQSGSVVATCSGSWEFPDSEDGSESEGRSQTDGSSASAGDESRTSREETAWMRRRNKESSLKIWVIGSNDEETASPRENTGSAE